MNWTAPLAVMAGLAALASDGRIWRGSDLSMIESVMLGGLSRGRRTAAAQPQEEVGPRGQAFPRCKAPQARGSVSRVTADGMSIVVGSPQTNSSRYLGLPAVQAVQAPQARGALFPEWLLR